MLNCEYLGKNETKFENILTRWSVAQTSSNDEKNWGSKISLDCPFKGRILTIIKIFLNCLFILNWNPNRKLAPRDTVSYPVQLVDVDVLESLHLPLLELGQVVLQGRQVTSNVHVQLQVVLVYTSNIQFVRQSINYFGK